MIDKGGLSVTSEEFKSVVPVKKLPFMHLGDGQSIAQDRKHKKSMHETSKPLHSDEMRTRLYSEQVPLPGRSGYQVRK